MKKRKRGFTLIEVLIVIIIIGILAGSILLAAGSSSDSASASRIVQDMKTIKKASMFLFAESYSWPSDVTDLEGYVDRGMSRYSLENFDEKGLYIKADLSESSAGLRDKLERMASGTGLYESSEGNLVSYSGGDFAYYPLTRSSTGSGALFVADFDSFGQFYDAQGSLDGIATEEGVLKWTNGGGIALAKDFSGKDYTVNVTAAYDGSGSGYGVAYRASGEDENENGDFEGYVFQFDPGLGEAFVVRTRSGYSEPITTDDVTGEKVRVSMGDDFDVEGEHDISISIEGTRHVVKVDGEIIMDFEDDTYTEGSAGIRTWTNGGKDNTTIVSDFEITGN